MAPDIYSGGCAFLIRTHPMSSGAAGSLECVSTGGGSQVQRRAQSGTHTLMNDRFVYWVLVNEARPDGPQSSVGVI